MKDKHIPMRKCLRCGKMKEKSKLIRIIKTDNMGNKEVLLDLDFKKFGRGAYVCKNPDCLRALRKAKRLERSFKCKINDDLYDSMEAIFQNE